MNAAFIYVKTEKGRDEVRARSHQLSARERALLIMVDGKRSVGDLGALNLATELEQHLHALLEAKLIAPLERLLADGSLPPPQAAAEPLVPSPPATARAASGSRDSDLEKACQYMRSVAEDTLGAEAAAFTRRLALLDNVQELWNLAQHLRDVLYQFTNAKEADQFLHTVREIAPKT